MKTSDFHIRLRNQLAAGTLSQAALARQSGVSQGTISKIIHGKKTILLSTAIRLWPFVYGSEFPSSVPISPSDDHPSRAEEALCPDSRPKTQGENHA